MSELLQCGWSQSKGISRLENRGGAAVASSGLKHGAPRNLVEGRVKLSIQSREQSTGPAIYVSRIHLNIPVFHFSFWRIQFDCCAAAGARRVRRTPCTEGDRFAARTSHVVVMDEPHYAV